jgi:hypothetical protein
MIEAERKSRNAQRLSECWPAFAARLNRVIQRLEEQGVRPRIQDAWRSPEEQLIAFNSGHSKLKYGFHNVTGANAAKEALAVDLLDDDAPLLPSTRYVLLLAAVARVESLETGILWGLPKALHAGVESALAVGDFDRPVKIGWDPCHVQPTVIRPSEAKAGVRPS